MKSKKWLSLGSAAILTFSAFASSCGEKKVSREPLPVYKYTYGMMSEDEMPVVTFGGPIQGYVKNGYKLDSMINDNCFRYFSEAGVNSIVGTANWVVNDNLEEITDCLTYAERYNINYVVFDTSVVYFNRKDIPLLSDVKFRERMGYYSQFKSFAGIYCQDEAVYQWLDELGTAHKLIYDYNKTFDTNLIAYSNMHPYWEDTSLYSEVDGDYSCDYEQLIRQFVEKGGLPYLSYDRYPLWGDRNDKVGTLDQEWFMNLGMIRGWAQEYKIPFWVCLPVGGFWNYKPPNETEFFWLVNSALACGAKGIEYFPGVHPTEGFYSDGSFADLGIVSMDGQKTQYYYYAKKIGEQIEATQKYFMNAASVGLLVDPKNSPDQNISNEFPFDMGEDYQFLLKSFREVKGYSDNALIGCFDYQGKTMLYVMNNQLVGDTEAVTVKFDGSYDYNVIQRGIARTASGKKLTLNLRAGEGALVLLK